MRTVQSQALLVMPASTTSAFLNSTVVAGEDPAPPKSLSSGFPAATSAVRFSALINACITPSVEPAGIRIVVSSPIVSLGSAALQCCGSKPTAMIIAIVQALLLLLGFRQEWQYLIAGLIVLGVIILHTSGERR